MAGIQRGYQPVDYGVQDRRQYDAQPVAQADTTVKAPVTVGDTAWRDRMVEGLAGKAAKVLDKATDIEFSNLYLEGQQAAGMIESENELQGNPITRDWKVAGYRDTMGKFALADTEAQFQLDLPKLREKGPEELAAYLEPTPQQARASAIRHVPHSTLRSRRADATAGSFGTGQALC